MTERQIADQSGGMLRPDLADDIVQRLCSIRTYNCYSCTEYGYDSECSCSMVADLLADAADEVERLRADLTDLQRATRSREAERQIADVPDDIVQELRDWECIIDGVQGKAVVMMLSGAVYATAADEIERLRAAGDALAEIICSWFEERVPLEMLDPLTVWEEARRG